MGKTKKSKDDQKKTINRTKKSSDDTETTKTVAQTLRSIELPTSADGLTADKLNAEQKIVFKKHCQNMYGHKFAAGKRKMPANTIESATVQLAAKMKERMERMKNKSSTGRTVASAKDEAQGAK